MNEFNPNPPGTPRKNIENSNDPDKPGCPNQYDGCPISKSNYCRTASCPWDPERVTSYLLEGKFL